MITRHEGHEEDQDSLFGSPPPSPRSQAPRAPSPALSLPSASTCDSERRLSKSTDTQNVGTIALPGSHPYSKLPVNPLALSLNHTAVHRPPAQSQGQPVPTNSWQEIQLGPNRSLVSSTVKGSKRSRQSSQSPPRNVSFSQSRDPEFSLPDPSAPPPAHFLRNQQNLLGKAGLVAGVKPATITHIRGATPSNPIIVDDEDTPILGRQSQSRDPCHPYVNPGLLAAPTNEDIVSVLIGQKDIFPVLEGILGLIGKGAARHTPLQTRDDPKHPPVKRRKLNRVPAGATDWDVPYPFQEGEGPDEYHKTWERKRGKHLVVQLVKLIKGAARKAATKNYIRNEQVRQAAWEKLQQDMMPKTMGSESIVKKDMTVNNHYKPQTITYGLEQTQAQKAMSQVFDALTNTINDLRVWPSEGSTTAINATQHNPFPHSSQTAQNHPVPPNQLSFDSLVSSLVAATPNQDSAVASSSGALTNSHSTNTSKPVDGSSSIASDDQSLFDTWMTFLQAFPVAFDTQSQSQSSLASCQVSMPDLHDFAFLNSTSNDSDFGANMGKGSTTTPDTAAVPDDLDALISSMLNSLPQNMESTPVSSSSSSRMDTSQPSLNGDDTVGPSLLALSMQPGSDVAQGGNESLFMSQAVSPVPSMCSSGVGDPMTPTSSAWEMSIPDIFQHGDGGGGSGDGGQGMFRHTLWDNFSQGAYQGSAGGDWAEVGHITRDSLSGMMPYSEQNMIGTTPMVGEKKDKGKEVLRTNSLGFLPANATPPASTQSQSSFKNLMGVQSTDTILPPFPSSTIYEQQERPTSAPIPRPPPRPKHNISQPRKEEILRRAREKRQQVQEELDRVKTQLWETTIEQAALVHLLKRCENDEKPAVG